MENIKANIDGIRLIGKEQFDALYQISKILNSAVYEDALINETLDLILKVVDAERGLFVKYMGDGEDFEIIAARNIQQENIEDLSAFSSGVLQKVIEHKKPFLSISTVI